MFCTCNMLMENCRPLFGWENIFGVRRGESGQNAYSLQGLALNLCDRKIYLHICCAFAIRFAQVQVLRNRVWWSTMIDWQEETSLTSQGKAAMADWGCISVCRRCTNRAHDWQPTARAHWQACPRPQCSFRLKFCPPRDLNCCASPAPCTISLLLRGFVATQPYLLGFCSCTNFLLYTGPFDARRGRLFRVAAFLNSTSPV